MNLYSAKDKDANASTQRALVASYLRENGSASTLELREIGVMSPASRIMELRRRGWVIITVPCLDHDPSGLIHRAGRYLLEQAGTSC